MPVYLIHFERPLNESSQSPFGKAQHYAGYAKRDIDARFKEHLNGSGAAILLCNAGKRRVVSLRSGLSADH
jgi:hypothetical protein